jgi:8-oxo-dGTP pyrophosphatase MutT (NUDIX family)
VEAALRETTEETTLDVATLIVRTSLVDEHGGWSYTTVVAEAERMVPIGTRGAEGLSLRWVPEDQVPHLPLHPGFAATWPHLTGV